MNTSRSTQALEARVSAAEHAASRPHPRHIANGDEQKFRHDSDTTSKQDEIGKPSYLASYTKGLPHDLETGLIKNPDHFEYLVKGIDSGDPRDFRDTPLGDPKNRMGKKLLRSGFRWRSRKARHLPKGSTANEPADVRAWESAGAGNVFDLEGPDAQAVTMPPAPALGSPELTAEMGEVYVQALLRDVPFVALALGTSPASADETAVNDGVSMLNALDWFNGADLDLNPAEKSRRRVDLKPYTAFRGITPGDDIGPYISQFLLAGHPGINGNDHEPGRDRSSGLISYGAISVDQKVRVAQEGEDHMTIWGEWLDVQNGADLRHQENYDDTAGNTRRFITTPRDLATYVHYDALYEAYLNACLILLGKGIPFDPGIPFQEKDQVDHQQGFAHFGGPHILSLVTEVATRALKAVRFQKFNVHRRLRPEVLAARIHKVETLGSSAPELQSTSGVLDDSGVLAAIFAHNEDQNQRYSHPPNKMGTHLLPMAFCEGSPMHPAYGAGHATVAGACVTILKAFFDHARPLAVTEAGSPEKAFVPAADGQTLVEVDVLKPNPDDASAPLPARLTVEGELNKLASNISIGRDWAGVHYFTDYVESIRMGEQIAIGILEEQKLMYRENFSMTVPLFDGGSIRI